ncbi:thermonuclease family protein [Paeniglutamicibacter sp. NPDC012692]|uniref:thermonuclease family protein n=1 Tax=Paeniglutamicibacter sp. NPDC012692 TaxID=3364388 RepID=UPI00369F4DD7
MPTSEASKKDSHATVVRIVDGDTIVADVSGAETTIRLLNIDTPETKDPNEPVQCLGPEATEYMKSLLAPGDKIDLEYDVQRLDPYGRTLAGVYKNDSLVNADIAAAGLGVAVLYQPNERFYAEVKAAEQAAQNAEEGLFSPSIDCTVPALVDQASAALEALEETDPESSAEAGTALAVVAAAVVAGKAKKTAFKALGAVEGGVASAVWAARKAKYLPRFDAALDRAAAMESKLAKTEAALTKSEREARAAKKAAAEAKEKSAAERKATAKRQAAAKKAAQHQRMVKKPYVAPKKTYPAPVQTRKPKSSGGSYSGYTGPRCYAPGGKTWKPCG